ncbi:hypothetical protein [Luteimonas sp. SDU101]|uniref:hypothetical protein n=1 Tax=Luteimonas sp. SDU101 TaxID=3422593 RepID=UPI003EBEC731
MLRYTNNVAEKLCHVVASATQVGLTQVLERTGEIMDNRKIDPDVFTVVMSLFGAVGTLATIADYVRGREASAAGD